MTSAEHRHGSVRLREVADSDMSLLWQWANDAEVRATAFHPEPIAWESHVTWFTARRADRTCRMHVITDAAGTPLGQLRIDFYLDHAEVHLSIAAEQRGRGVGP